jgi:hypothetical protein
VRLLVLAAMAGCTPAPPPGGNGDDGPFHDGTPSIISVSWSCNGDDATWTFEVETEGWTGGGTLWMAREANTAEKHHIYSVSAASDGSADSLELELDVAEDWRDASPGSSTRWRCLDLDDISYLLTVSTPTGSETADCRTWGVDPDVFGDVSGAEVCENILVDDTGE